MKARKSLFRQLYPSFLGILLMALVALLLLLTLAFKDFYLKITERNLEERLNIIEPTVIQSLEQGPYQLISYFNQLKGETRFSFISLSGQLLADNKISVQEKMDFRNRQEVIEAFERRRGVSQRYSYDFKNEYFYVAHLIPEKGILRAAISMNLLYASTYSIYREVVIVGLLMFLAISFVSFRFISRVTRPIERLKQVALEIAKGEFYSKVYFSTKVSEEVHDLGLAINQISDEIQVRVKEAHRRREEQEAILSSMKEAVVALSINEEILYCNMSAKSLFNLTERCQHLTEVTRNPQLLEYVREGIQTQSFSEYEVLVDDKYLEMNLAPIRGRKHNLKAVVWVLRDLSEIKKLEKYRKDFVANVSHELKTPLTSIQGFAETLLNPKLEDTEQKRQFTQVIFDQSQRLGQLIQDLLTLSRIEYSGPNYFEFEILPIRPIIESAVQICSHKAQKKEVSIEILGEDKILVSVHRSLLEQALINLIDNAIKYSSKGQKILLSYTKKESVLVIKVQDQGPGIEATHLPRLFERFYRIDKARSREQGGTGLGLSIVKHVCQLHGGQVSVSSELKKGSEFIIELPIEVESKRPNFTHQNLTKP